jgi:hypothetical protein
MSSGMGCYGISSLAWRRWIGRIIKQKVPATFEERTLMRFMGRLDNEIESLLEWSELVRAS